MSFKSFLLEISNDIEKSELESMKYCCEDYCGDKKIGSKRLQEISEARQLFDELIKRNLLGPDNTQILVQLLEKADRYDLSDRVLKRQVSSSSGTQDEVTDGPVVNDKLKDARLNDIAEDLGRDWKPLGRRLGLSTNILDNIDAENKKVKEKAFQMMSKWKKHNGNKATGQILADALIAVSRKDVAETLAKICKDDGINIDASGERTQNSQGHQETGGLNTIQADLASALPTQESEQGI
ncbi:FAS-associated death domain protein-like [Dendronephthya gigantea]|uniref:FAS-associated death domain protein-like n=1 Tax=Dendronephthya gigantea TaxID=151771 RepID=UPI00106CF84C|nr:FAS-associated death domain protein-like [Dendronephthya gigantea]